jgi:hypothetical protein
MSDASPTHARVLGLFEYEPDTGSLQNRVWRNGTAKNSKAAGCYAMRHGLKYLDVSIDGKQYPAHRIIWLYMTGEWPGRMHVDHIDGDASNNSWTNLRLATPAQNAANSKRQSNNTSGYKGVTFDSVNRKWRAEIRFNRKLKNLGRFDTPERAHEAYVDAAKALFGEFARAG